MDEEDWDLGWDDVVAGLMAFVGREVVVTTSVGPRVLGQTFGTLVAVPTANLPERPEARFLALDEEQDTGVFLDGAVFVGARWEVAPDEDDDTLPVLVVRHEDSDVQLDALDPLSP